MPSVLLPKPASGCADARPYVHYDPRPYMVEATAEFEALRQYIRMPIDLDPGKLLELAQNASQAILQIAVSMAQAEQQSRRPQAIIEPAPGPTDAMMVGRADDVTASEPAPGPDRREQQIVKKTVRRRRQPHQVGSLLRGPLLGMKGPWG